MGGDHVFRQLRIERGPANCGRQGLTVTNDNVRDEPLVSRSIFPRHDDSLADRPSCSSVGFDLAEFDSVAS